MDFLNYWDTRIDANERFFNNYPHIANFAFSECQELWDRMSADYAALQARHNALAEAKQTISECLQDTAFRNGVKAGWNAALIKDDVEAEKQYALLMADNNDRLKTLKSARAEVDRLLGEK